jgi:hypothetical protein
VSTFYLKIVNRRFEMPELDQYLSFSEKETEVLKQIVSDWLNEGLVLPPFESAVQAVLNKLGLSGEEQSSEIYPKTQEQLSTPSRSLKRVNAHR